MHNWIYLRLHFPRLSQCPRSFHLYKRPDDTDKFVYTPPLLVDSCLRPSPPLLRGWRWLWRGWMRMKGWRVRVQRGRWATQGQWWWGTYCRLDVESAKCTTRWSSPGPPLPGSSSSQSTSRSASSPRLLEDLEWLRVCCPGLDWIEGTGSVNGIWQKTVRKMWRYTFTKLFDLSPKYSLRGSLMASKRSRRAWRMKKLARWARGVYTVMLPHAKMLWWLDVRMISSWRRWNAFLWKAGQPRSGTHSADRRNVYKRKHDTFSHGR